MNRESICVCGHQLDDHHVSWFPGYENPIVEECEYDGSNEHGGSDGCYRFRLCDCGCNDG